MILLKEAFKQIQNSCERYFTQRLSFTKQRSQVVAIPESARYEDIIDMRGISLRALEELLLGVINETHAPNLRLFVAVEDINDDIKKGTTIQMISISKEGLLRGLISSSKKTVRLNLDDKFVEKRREDWSTTDVVEYVILPLTNTLNAPRQYLNLLNKEDIGREYQGAFVSQARSSRFKDLVEALQAFFDGGNPETSFIWLDLFSANQTLLAQPKGSCPHIVQSAREIHLRRGLHNAVAKFDQVVIFFDNWEKPAPLNRAWCVWEILGALKSDRNIRIICTPQEERRFKKFALNHPGLPASHLCNLHYTDMSKAQCWKTEDKVMIDEAVSSMMKDGYSTLNEFMNATIQEWSTTIIEDFSAQ